MAKMVGENGRVIAVDIQERMLSAIERRAKRSDLHRRITLQWCSEDSLGIHEKVDFILAFWMLHEVPDQERFLTELLSLLNDKGYFLLVEPKIHTTRAAFEASVRLAVRTGFTQCECPDIFLGRSVLFEKQVRECITPIGKKSDYA